MSATVLLQRCYYSERVFFEAMHLFNVLFLDLFDIYCNSVLDLYFYFYF